MIVVMMMLNTYDVEEGDDGSADGGDDTCFPMREKLKAATEIASGPDANKGNAPGNDASNTPAATRQNSCGTERNKYLTCGIQTKKTPAARMRKHGCCDETNKRNTCGTEMKKHRRQGHEQR